MKTLILGFLMGTGLCSVLLFWGLCRGLFDRACGKQGERGYDGMPGPQGPEGPCYCPHRKRKK